jgi:hypothetical protein
LSREASRSKYAHGTEFQIGRIEMIANTGTYVDSPFHRYENGKDLSELSLETQETIIIGQEGIAKMISTQSLKKRLDTKRALIYFFVAYTVVTVLATATTVVYGIVNRMPENEPGVSLLKDPSFTATVPYHVLIMLLVWPVFAWLYFRKRQQENPDKEVMETLHLSFLWLAAAVVVDWVCFVLIKHPYSLTLHEFYVEYQPWISLIYASIFLSPLIHLGLSRLLTKRVEVSPAAADLTSIDH